MRQVDSKRQLQLMLVVHMGAEQVLLQPASRPPGLLHSRLFCRKWPYGTHFITCAAHTGATPSKLSHQSDRCPLPCPAAGGHVA